MEEDSLNDLIQRAVTGRDTPVAGADVGLPDEDEAESFETPLTPEPDDNAPAASAEDFSTPLEPVEKLPEPDDVGSSESADNFETPLVPEPTQPAPAPVTAIPTLGGSFDQGGFDAARLPGTPEFRYRICSPGGSACRPRHRSPRPSLSPLRLKYTA